MSTNNPSHASIKKERTTKETDISICLQLGEGDLHVDTSSPFFTHMLTSMLFHGGWSGHIKAKGDIEIDEHHLVEDTGIVIGSIFSEYAFLHQPIARFGHASIPMDDALAEAVVDFSNRAYLHYDVTFPSPLKTFDIALGREFFMALAHNACINLHLITRYGLNSHHIIESLFKACGKAIKKALRPSHTIQSIKGSL